MSILFSLLKANAYQIFNLNQFRTKSIGSRLKYLGMGLLILYAVGCMLFGMGFFYYRTAVILESMNLLVYLLPMGYTSAVMVVIFISVYMAPGYLYAFKDFDLLMSLPISNRVILLSKLIYLYLSNLAASMLVTLPCWLVYGYMAKENGLFYGMVIALELFIPLLPLLMGALLGLVLGKVASGFKKSNIIMLIGSVVMILAFMVLSVGINLLTNEQIKSSSMLLYGITTIFYPADLIVKALSTQNGLAVVGFIGISVGLFGAFIYLMANNFKKINAKMNEHGKSETYEMKALKVTSPFMALLRKEIHFYFSTYIYALNTGFGLVMMTLFSVALPFFGNSIIMQVQLIPQEVTANGPTPSEILVLTLLLYMLFCVSMSFITAPAISLEGDRLWIVKSLPVSTVDILRSKIALQLVIVTPVLLLNLVVIGICVPMNVLDFLTMCVLLLIYNVFIAQFGLIVNLLLPKMSWKAPVVVVKQSASVLVATFAAFGILFGVGYVYVMWISLGFLQITVGLCVLFLILNLLAYGYIKTAGVRRFNAL